jgi:hypothetical protein
VEEGMHTAGLENLERRDSLGDLGIRMSIIFHCVVFKGWVRIDPALALWPLRSIVLPCNESSGYM